MDDAVDRDVPDSGPQPADASSGPDVVPSEPAARRRIRTFALSLIAALVVFQGAALAYSFARGPTGPWLGEYFEGQDFKGPVRVRYTRKLEFDWGKEPPFRGMPRDRWSVVYTTCLEIDEESEVRFRLTSDDGSRLYIDGERLVDNWGPHSPRTRTGKILLEPGVYELVVEYFEASHGAELKLVAQFGPDGKHESLPLTQLHQPSNDPEQRCVS